MSRRKWLVDTCQLMSLQLPDLTVMDFFFWVRVVKELMQPIVFEELKLYIRDVLNSIDDDNRELCETVCSSILARLLTVHQCNGKKLWTVQIVNKCNHHVCQYSSVNMFSLVSSDFTYTGCNRRNVRDFGRMFLRSNYTNITQNTYIQSWTVTEIMAGEVWNFDSCYSLIDYQIHIETGRNMWFL